MEQNDKKSFADRIAVNIDEEKTKKIIEQFAIQTAKIRDFKKETEAMEPTIQELANGYKSYIEDLGEGFLKIVETYNEALHIAKPSEILGNAKIKARIKDFSSSVSNTDKKILDDVFGMEIVTDTEFEKEIILLFNHLVFNINKDKNMNKEKTTGYFAHHCMGDFNPNDEITVEQLAERIKRTKTMEFRYSQNGELKKVSTNLFPNLKKYIENEEDLIEIAEILSEMVEYMKTITIPMDKIPSVEFHFLTSNKEQEAIRGRASHSNYKKVNQELIENYFLKGRLIRGINAPWKFESSGQYMVLQDFYKTLLENWPFLRDEIAEKRKEGRADREKERVSYFDKLTATQFSFLRKYLKKENKYDENKDENWGLLKAIIVANRINFNDKTARPIADDIMDYIIGR